MECSSTTTPNVPFPYTIVQHIPCSKTAPRDAVVTKQGRNATQHVEVKSSVAPECPASFPPGVQTPSGSGGGEGDDFFARLLYMDDAVLVEAIPESSSSSRCLQASASLASDHFGLWLGPEFHADVEFWPLTVAWGMWSSVGTLEAPLYSLYPQRPSYTLWSDPSGDALGG